MKTRTLLMIYSRGIAASIALMYTQMIAADTPSYKESAAYIQEKGIVESKTPNEYYDSAKESDYHTTVFREVHRKIQFPSKCVMDIVNDRFEEVAPPTGAGLDNNYGLTEQVVITVNLTKVVPSKIYGTKRPPDGTAVIIKARKGGISSRTEKFFDQTGNKNLYGLTMRKAATNSIDSPFGKMECAVETCTRTRAFNGYGITPSETKYTDGLRDALINIVKLCGGTG